MKRGWFIVLALSLGLNAGLTYVHLSQRAVEPKVMSPVGDLPAPMKGVGPMDHPDGPRGFMRDRLDRAGDRLNLTEEQKESMSAILSDVMPELVNGREEIRGLRMKMRDEYLRPSVDADKIQELRRETAAMQSKLDSIMVETMLREAEILTPEQREGYFHLMPFGDKGPSGRRMRKGHGRWGN